MQSFNFHFKKNNKFSIRVHVVKFSPLRLTSASIGWSMEVLLGNCNRENKNLPTNRRADMRAHRKVTLPIRWDK